MNNFAESPPDWNSISELEIRSGVRLRSKTVAVADTNVGLFIVSLHSFGARLRLTDTSAPKTPERDYDILLNEPDIDENAVSLELHQSSDGESTLVAGAEHQLRIFHNPLHFELLKGERGVQKSPTDSHFVRRFRIPPFARLENSWLLSFELNDNEPVYGAGEKWGRLDKRGQLVRSYNEDALGVNAEVSYKNTPFSWSPNGWGLFAHTPAPVTHAIGYAPWSQRSYCIQIEDAVADLFILSGDSGAQIISDYTALTGRPPMPPVWSLGVILSKAYYRTSEELLETAKQVRENRMPCDTITIDGRAWQDTETRFAFEWDKGRYPDPLVVIDQLKALNFKVCIWEYPLVSVKNPLFQEMSAKGWLLKDARTGETYRYQWDMSCFDEVLTPLPDSGIVDFTHPEAYAFWRDAHKPLFDLGIDMIKADFGEQIESNMLASNGEHGAQLHNVYSLLYNRCVYEAAERYCKSGPFLFSRSAWTGSQRYPSQWGGDPQADWGGFAGNLRGGLSWGLSGGPFYATDIGGFYADQRDATLYVRWLQAGVFSAHMRLHGIGQREPWSYGAEAERAAIAALKLRYRLLPYIEESMQISVNTGLPIQRSMVLAFPEDRAAWSFEGQFMFGEKLLVVPCLNPDGHVEFYLPSGQWKRFLHNENYTGSCTYRLRLALDEIAVFMRADDEIQLGPELEHTNQLTGSIN